jgi:TPR repeat protein
MDFRSSVRNMFQSRIFDRFLSVAVLILFSFCQMAAAHAQGISLGSDNADSIAIVIGNKTYRQTVPVDFAHNDADAIGDYLVKGLGFRPGNVTIMKDATQSEIVQVFGSERNPQGRLFNRAVEAKSNVFVFFSGHGVPDLKSRQPFLLPSDGDANQAESGYLLDTLYRNLELVKQKIGVDRQLIIMIDACFTGETGRKGETLLAVSTPGFAPARPRAGNGIVRLIATSGTAPANWDENLKLSLFTSRFLMGVSGLASQRRAAAGSNQVQWADLVAYMKDEVQQTARRTSGREQIPEIDTAAFSLTVSPVPAVERAITAARDEMNWREAEQAGTREAFERYVARCGSVCVHRQAAMSRLMQQQQSAGVAIDEQNWQRLSRENRHEEYLRICAPICAYKGLAESYLAAANPDLDPRVRSCDQLAASEADVDRPKNIASTLMARMDKPAAIKACGEAVQAFPNNRRLNYQLGRAYDGAGEYPKAVAAYRAAVALGSAAAMNNLAAAHENGQGAPQSLVEAAKFYRRGAEGGDRFAMSNIARMAEYGRGTPRDIPEAAKWYKQAADLGDLFSNTKYANFMIDNTPGVPREPIAAILRLQKSIDGGEPMAMVTFALMIDKGFPMQNYTSRTSIDLLRSALKAGESGARTVAVEATFNQMKLETRMALQKDMAQNAGYRGPLDGRMSSGFAEALISHARKLETRP